MKLLKCQKIKLINQYAMIHFLFSPHPQKKKVNPEYLSLTYLFDLFGKNCEIYYHFYPIYIIIFKKVTMFFN